VYIFHVMALSVVYYVALYAHIMVCIFITTDNRFKDVRCVRYHASKSVLVIFLGDNVLNS